MTATATITGKRQVTIPAEIFNKANFSQGQRVVFSLDKETGTIELKSAKDLVAELGGSLAHLVPEKYKNNPPSKEQTREAIGNYLAKKHKLQ